jgi:glycerol-3-phosphate dehydrogenase
MPKLSDQVGEKFDVAIVGGGVVGCALARRLVLEGAKTILIEAASDILAGASKANSAILHTGFDAPVGSLEHAMIRSGYAEYLQIFQELSLPILKAGAMVVAWNDTELAQLQSIYDKARRNGVEDVAILDPHRVGKREPHLAPSCGAVLVPGESLVDPWSTPLAYLKQAVENGGVFRRNAELKRGTFDGRTWHLETSGGQVLADWVANCAGLYGDRVDAILAGTARFAIRPRKGQFVVFDKAARNLLDTIILPVPTERTKGVVLCPTIFGNVLVGPTAEDQDHRDQADVDQSTLELLVATAQRIMPGIAESGVTAIYAGLRPATEQTDYRFFVDPDRRLATLGGIRSTGLTAALGLARHAASAMGLSRTKLDAPKPVTMPNLAEHLPRDWQAIGRDEIVCHCEMVTKREIEAAFQGQLGARDIGGIKRRTRATMGRCQGFYCMARVAALAGEGIVPLATKPEVAHG